MTNDVESKAKIEAALYVSGRPLTAEELAKAAELTSKRKAVALARSLMQFYNSPERAIQIVEYSGSRFAMQLKPQYSKVAKRFSMKPLLSQSTLKTLSYIAFFQPITSQDLVEKRGPQAYQHIRQLEQMGFIEGEPSGKTKVYRTTTTFSEYFGLSSDPEQLKKELQSKGVKLL
ncbi:MAG: SMC-Scp complex subunit ScpB [Nitrososphaerales archaeon]